MFVISCGTSIGKIREGGFPEAAIIAVIYGIYLKVMPSSLAGSQLLIHDSHKT